MKMYLITNLRDRQSYTLGLQNMRIFKSANAAKKYFDKSDMRTARIWEVSDGAKPKLVAIGKNWSRDPGGLMWETK